MITPEKLQTPEKPLDSGEASIYVLVLPCPGFALPRCPAASIVRQIQSRADGGACFIGSGCPVLGRIYPSRRAGLARAGMSN